MNPAARALQHPSIDTPVLEWWANHYDHVFVVLNPFFRVPGYSPRTTAYGPVRRDLSVDALLDQIKNPPPPAANAAPEDFDDIIKVRGEPIRWSHIQRRIGASDFDTFARSVWLWALQVERADRNAEICAKLDALCAAESIYPPEDDQLPAVLEPAIGRYLTALGHTHVQVLDEWRQTSQTVEVEDFAKGQPSLCIPGEKLSAIAADGVLFSWAFDDVQALLAVSDGKRGLADPAEYFEGFALGIGAFCDVFNPAGFLKRTPSTPSN